MNVRRNLALNFLLSAGQILFPLITIPYITRVLDPEGVGKVAFMDSLSYFFTVIAEFGIVTYGIREVARVQDDDQERARVVSELLAIQFIASSIALVLYGISIFIWLDKIGDPVLVVLSASFFLANFLYCEWYFWGRERFRFITLRSLVIRLLGIGAILLLVKERTDNRMYYGVMVASAIAVLLVNFVVLVRENRLSFRGLAAKRHVKPLLVNFGISMAYSITTLTDVPLVRLVAGVHTVGLYAMAARLVRLCSSLLTDIFLVMYPHSVRIAGKDEHGSLHRVLPDHSDLLLAVSIPASALLFICAQDIVDIALGPSFSGTAPLIRILSPLPAIVSYSLFLNKQVLMVHDREDLVLRALLVGNLFFLPAGILLTQAYGGHGACLALVLAESIILVFHYRYGIGQIPSRTLASWPTLARIVVGMGALFPIRWLVDACSENNWTRLTLTVIISVAFLAIWTLWVIRPRIARQAWLELIDRKKNNTLG